MKRKKANRYGLSKEEKQLQGMVEYIEMHEAIGKLSHGRREILDTFRNVKIRELTPYQVLKIKKLFDLLKEEDTVNEFI